MRVVLPGEDSTTTTTQAPAGDPAGLLNLVIWIGVPLLAALMGNSFLEIIELNFCLKLCPATFAESESVGLPRTSANGSEKGSTETTLLRVSRSVILFLELIKLNVLV
jgi:hypothetical protein